MDFQTLPVSVRVGQAVDVIGKVGNPKSIAGGHVHTTPVLMFVGEKAELVTDLYEPLSSVLEGFVILKEKILWIPYYFENLNLVLDLPDSFFFHKRE